MQKIILGENQKSVHQQNIEKVGQEKGEVVLPKKVEDFSKEINLKNNTSQKDSYEPSIGKKVGGYLLGSTALGLTTNAVRMPISLKCMSLIKKIGDNMSEAEFSKIKEATEKALNETGLAEKGVNLINASAENLEQIENILKTELNNNKITRFLPKFVKDLLVQKHVNVFKKGKNACYTMASKKIIMPTTKELSWAVFHEMGHAMNANLSRCGKALQKCRGFTIFMIPIALIALLKNKKPDGVKAEGVVDKTTTFIKENAETLTFASFTPMLIEEGLASIKGGRIAKKLLSPELAKKVAKGNKIAYMTYLGVALASALGVGIAKRIRDKVVSPKKDVTQ